MEYLIKFAVFWYFLTIATTFMACGGFVKPKAFIFIGGVFIFVCCPILYFGV